MKRVFSAETLHAVAHVKNLLEHEGIDCELRNENLGSVMGEVPFIAVWPEVWIRDERDLERAEAIVRRLREKRTAEGPPWRCSACGAENEQQFGACWQCSRPG